MAAVVRRTWCWPTPVTCRCRTLRSTPSFAAGLIGHVPDVDPTLRELARVTRAGGRLALFHPSGRAALAARHGRSVRPDDSLAERPLDEALSRTGWRADRYDDASHRFFALATRVPR